MRVVLPCPSLSGKLCDTKTHPDPSIAYALAALSGYAYSQQATFLGIAKQLGLDRYLCATYEQFVDVMFIDSTAYLLQSEDGRVVILVYRGTSPESLINWLTDIDVDPEDIEIEFHDKRGTFSIHRGFHRNLLATLDDILAALSRALNKRSVTLGASGEPTPVPEAMQALYITGHSLGGAMAAMAALLLRTDRAHQDIFKKLRSVYTFGQPMIGDRKLAALCDDPDVLGEKLIRYVFGHDFATQLPPSASGDFAHFGRELRHQSTVEVGDWRESGKKTGQINNLFELAVLIPSFLARQLRATRHFRFGASLDDHLPQHYIATLASGNLPLAGPPAANRRPARRSAASRARASHDRPGATRR